MKQPRKRRASVTKLKRGERLTIEIELPRTGLVVVRVPAGGTLRVEKSTLGLKEAADMT